MSLFGVAVLGVSVLVASALYLALYVRWERGETGGLELLVDLLEEVRHQVAHAAEIDLRERRDVRPNQVDDVIGDEHAQRAERRSNLRDENRRDAELARDRGGVDRAVAAVGNERERARIGAMPGEHLPRRVCHVGVHYPFDPPRRFGDADAERCRDVLLDGGTRRVDVEAHASARESVRRQVSQHCVGIGDGWVGAAAAVTRRSGDRSG